MAEKPTEARWCIRQGERTRPRPAQGPVSANGAARDRRRRCRVFGLVLRAMPVRCGTSVTERRETRGNAMGANSRPGAAYRELNVGPNEGLDTNTNNKMIKINELNKASGGEGGIRTLDTFPYTHFPGVLLRPLGHLSAIAPGGRLCYRLRCNSRKPHVNLRSGVVLEFQVSLDSRSATEPRKSGNRPAMRTGPHLQHHG